jgi:hypothetical protein
MDYCFKFTAGNFVPLITMIHYQVLATSALLFLSADKAREVMQVCIGPHVAKWTHFVFVVMAIGTLIHALLLFGLLAFGKLPFPLAWPERYRFDQANPEAAALSRSERVRLYRRWKGNEHSNPPHSR